MKKLETKQEKINRLQNLYIQAAFLSRLTLDAGEAQEALTGAADVIRRFQADEPVKEKKIGKWASALRRVIERSDFYLQPAQIQAAVLAAKEAEEAAWQAEAYAEEAELLAQAQAEEAAEAEAQAEEAAQRAAFKAAQAAFAAELQAALAAAGFVTKDTISDLSDSFYVAERGGRFKIRISDHTLPPSYSRLNGQADLELNFAGPDGLYRPRPEADFLAETANIPAIVDKIKALVELD